MFPSDWHLGWDRCLQRNAELAQEAARFKHERRHHPKPREFNPAKLLNSNTDRRVPERDVDRLLRLVRVQGAQLTLTAEDRQSLDTTAPTIEGTRSLRELLTWLSSEHPKARLML